MSHNRPSYDAFRAVRHFPALDGLRAASIVAVIWHHAGPHVADWPIAARGFLGVDMFFSLSGFLIVTLLLRERDRNGGIDLSAFYARRSLRIFPPYYALLALVAVAYGLLQPDSPATDPFFAHLTYYLTYTSNWVPDATLLSITWSLATEEQFYLAWPPLEKHLGTWFGRVRSAISPAILLLLAFLALNQAVNFGLLDEVIRAQLGVDRGQLEILQATFTPICLGVLLAHALHHPRGFAIVARLADAPRAAAVLAVTICLLASVPGDISGWPRLSIQAAMTLLLASCVLRPDAALPSFLSRRLPRRIGAISYGMYLYHLLARHAAAAALARIPGVSGENAPNESLAAGGSLPLFALTLAATIVAAEASFRWFESPILAWKDRFARNGSGRN